MSANTNPWITPHPRKQKRARRSALPQPSQTDEPRSFHLFLELLRELRDQIYLEAARNIQRVELPSWESERKTWLPNILNTSLQIRTEAEEYILSECILVVNLTRDFECDEAGYKTVGVSISPATESYCNSLSDTQFSKIKRLRFSFHFSCYDWGFPYPDLEAYTNLTRGRQDHLSESMRRSDGGLIVDAHISSMHTLLADICVRGKSAMFERSDLERIIGAISDQVKRCLDSHGSAENED